MTIDKQAHVIAVKIVEELGVSYAQFGLAKKVTDSAMAATILAKGMAIETMKRQVLHNMPDILNRPEEANYLTQDRSGRWDWHFSEDIPTQSEDQTQWIFRNYGNGREADPKDKTDPSTGMPTYSKFMLFNLVDLEEGDSEEESVDLSATVEANPKFYILSVPKEPNWQDAPEWAKYYAVDEDGSAYFYKEKPQWEEDRWVPAHINGADSTYSVVATVKVTEAKTSLREKPAEDLPDPEPKDYRKDLEEVIGTSSAADVGDALAAIAQRLIKKKQEESPEDTLSEEDQTPLNWSDF